MLTKVSQTNWCNSTSLVTLLKCSDSSIKKTMQKGVTQLIAVRWENWLGEEFLGKTHKLNKGLVGKLTGWIDNSDLYHENFKYKPLQIKRISTKKLLADVSIKKSLFSEKSISENSLVGMWINSTLFLLRLLINLFNVALFSYNGWFLKLDSSLQNFENECRTSENSP